MGTEVIQLRHVPVMVKEVIDFLKVRNDGKYIDATIGFGGHSLAILHASSPKGIVVGCDVDPFALEVAKQRLKDFGERFQPILSCYSELDKYLPLGEWDGVLFDLGAGLYHFELPERGFSFQQDGPLDMRYNTEWETTAADIVNNYSYEELVRLFKYIGGEPFARPIARAIEQRRQIAPIKTTRELAQLIEKSVPKRIGDVHPATRVFMALRIAVNRELERLSMGLETAFRLLKPRGRLVVITFHSGEARLVKEFGKRYSRNYEVVAEVDKPEFRKARPPQLRWITQHPIKPSREELAINLRARSAAMYVMEKLSPEDSMGV